MEKPVVRSRFKGPEGRYELHSERTSGLVNFNPLKAPRLTLASLSSGPEQGSYVLCNIGDSVFVFNVNSIDKDPLRTVNFGTAQVRGSYPVCHSFHPIKDGADLLVGMGTGEVLLVSFRSVLSHPGPIVKPSILATFNAEGAQDASRCMALAWLPKQDTNVFAAAYQSGMVFLYKKSSSMASEGGSKFSLSSLSSSTKSLSPLSTIFPNAGVVHDLAFSPDASKLALACRDGGLRIYEAPQGSKDAWQLAHGLQSYYGSQLCCCWSPCGRYVASGGEDDQVMVYGLAERCVQAWGEGHTSWISRLAFDPWVSPLAPSTAGSVVPQDRALRLGSVGQDAQICLWDVPLYEESNSWQPPAPPASSSPTAATAARKGVGLGFSYTGPPFGSSSADRNDSGSGSSKGSYIKGSSNGNGAACSMTQAVPRADMSIISPVTDHRIHLEPVSDLLFMEHVFLTVCYAGQIKCWRRPGHEAPGNSRYPTT